jgi:TrmH family RNA methyltransferase
VTAYPKITNRQHPIVQTCRALVRGRGDAGAVLLDGEHLVAEALRAGLRIRSLLMRAGADPTFVGRVRASGAEVYEVTDPVLEAASPVRTPSGLVAVAEWRYADLAATVTPPPALAIGLVDVQDPGNVGGAIRSSHALGATGVITIGQTADPGGWKALRGAMGSTFRLPVARETLADVLASARTHGLRIFATVASKSTPIDAVDLTRPALVLLGNEGAGLSPEIAEQADEHVTVRMRSGVDSLNVAVTAAVILYEARRQRAMAGR